MPVSTSDLMLTADHTCPAGPGLVQVLSGGTVYYRSQPTVNSSTNDGSIAVAGSQYFQTGVWLAATTPTAVHVVSDDVAARRPVRRVVAVAQSATPAINTDVTDVASITGLAQAITSMTSGLTGTPQDGDSLLIRFTDNGTGRAITFGTSFEASTVALPTTTTLNVMLTVEFIWNIATSKWRCVRVA